MKTLEELYKDVMASDELKKEFAEAAKSRSSVEAWLKEHGCGASVEELGTFLKEKNEGEMTDDDAEAVAGGKIEDITVTISIISVGIMCVVYAVQSAKEDTAMSCLET